MPVKLQWADDAHTILIYVLRGDWSTVELLEAFTLAERLTAPHAVVDRIVDFTDSTNVPPGILTAFTTLARRVGARRTHFGIMVVVGTDSFLQQLMRVIRQLFPKLTDDMHYLQTREQAIALIREQRTARHG